jgi:DNA polymerase-3 subunit gamma/tau
MLAGAMVAVEDSTLVLTHESAPLAKRLSEQRNTDVIREASQRRPRCGLEGALRTGAAEHTPGTAPPGLAPAQSAAVRSEEDGMLAEAGQDYPGPCRDPEEVALELLQTELGARRIDGLYEGVHHGRNADRRLGRRRGPP